MHFCVLCRNSRWLPKIVGKQFQGKVTSGLCRYPGGQKFVETVPFGTVSKINVFLRFTQKFKMAAKNSGKTILAKSCTQLCTYPCGQKFHLNRSISHRFRHIKDFSFSELRKFVLFSLSLISQPFCFGSLPKVNDFQTSI